MMAGFGIAGTALRVLAAALFAAFNLVPLYGIYAWGWDAFQLLLLYWAETVILFACTLAHIAFIPPERLGTMIINGKTVAASRRMLIGFFALHGGMFVAVHLLFLCVLFSGDRFSRLDGVADLLRTFFIVSGAWLPLILVALGGTIDVLTSEFHPAFVDALARRLHVALARPAAAPGGDAVGSIVGALYLRIFIMQAAIIFGAMASRRYGTLAPLVIVIGLKTLIDLGSRLAAISGPPSPPLMSGVRVTVEGPGFSYSEGGRDGPAPRA
jgi:Family of unknown function (DUF6498)